MQDPVPLGKQWYELTLSNPVSAITSGASVQLDVSSQIQWDDTKHIDEVRKQLQKYFPKKSIKAKLVASDGEEMLLVYDGNSLISRDAILLSLYSENEIPIGKGFVKIKIYSGRKIEDVLIYWKNYMK